MALISIEEQQQVNLTNAYQAVQSKLSRADRTFRGRVIVKQA
jgi:hypothetical protein